MYKANFGYEFDTMEKVNEFNDGANVCYGGCKSKEDVSDEYCHKCKLINECIQYYQDIEQEINL